MTSKMLCSFLFAIAIFAAAMVLRQTALAGPPLICHSIEIGNAKSLPWNNGSEWRALKPDYDLNRLVDETLALLTPETPVLVRMETLRRATIYAVWAKRDRESGFTVKDDKVADELLSRLMERIRGAVQANQPPAFALFDAGYLTACYQQAGYYSNNNTPNNSNSSAMARKALDGYAMVRKASGAAGTNSEMEFAAALISRWPQQPAHREHLQRAIVGAKEGSLLARNLVKHFGQHGQSLADLRAQVASLK